MSINLFLEKEFHALCLRRVTWQNPNLVNRESSSDESSGELDESNDQEDDEGTDESDDEEETPKKVRACIPILLLDICLCTHGCLSSFVM